MNLRRTLMIACTAGSLLTAGSLFASPQSKTTQTTQTTTTTQTKPAVRSDVPADLAKDAKISLETARTTALAKVPHGEVRSEELEKEHGKLIYSFDIAVPGKSGIQEVNVNAITGKVIGVHHESAKDEKKEAAKEHKPSGR
ncbi:MAG: PepSY domain-containing protein [Acidobacteria bacterium]|nr:PepSY domain-containing protein [Acidobacteriota bacterium]